MVYSLATSVKRTFLKNDHFNFQKMYLFINLVILYLCFVGSCF